MLNITRKIGEKIIIGEDIVLEVMEVSGSSVRIGIRAPRSVPVYREEIWEAVRSENAAAASAPATLPTPPGATPPADAAARPSQALRTRGGARNAQPTSKDRQPDQ